MVNWWLSNINQWTILKVKDNREWRGANCQGKDRSGSKKVKKHRLLPFLSQVSTNIIIDLDIVQPIFKSMIWWIHRALGELGRGNHPYENNNKDHPQNFDDGKSALPSGQLRSYVVVYVALLGLCLFFLSDLAQAQFRVLSCWVWCHPTNALHSIFDQKIKTWCVSNEIINIFKIDNYEKIVVANLLFKFFFLDF